MDILISLVDTEESDLRNLIKEVSASNLSRAVQDELVNVLYTVIAQTHEAKSMGWL